MLNSNFFILLCRNFRSLNKATFEKRFFPCFFVKLPVSSSFYSENKITVLFLQCTFSLRGFAVINHVTCDQMITKKIFCNSEELQDDRIREEFHSYSDQTRFLTYLAKIWTKGWMHHIPGVSRRILRQHSAYVSYFLTQKTFVAKREERVRGLVRLPQNK